MDQDDLIGQNLGHYQILDKLGQGGMGVVYRARDTRLDRIVAVKVLPAEKMSNPEKRKRFIQEAKAASLLNHPNIITIYEVGTAECAGREVIYIAMEYVQGDTLLGCIPAGGLRLSELLRWVVQIADALATAHAAGIAHRDIKPSNIMITGSPCRIKVLDFGLAKLDERMERPTTSTATIDVTPRTEEGIILGTPAYLAPEIAEGAKADSRSDIFSFGCLLYEMATGRQAFQGSSNVSTLAAILHKEPTPVAHLVTGVPHELEWIIDRCLRKDPNRRAQSMADLKAALEDLQGKYVADRAAPQPEPPGAPAVPPARGARLWTRVLIGLVFLTAVGLLAWWRLRPAPPPPWNPVLRRLTSDPGLNAYPTLSRATRMLAYASDRGGEGNLDIWVRQIGGGEPIRLTRSAVDDYEPHFSPDGTRIVFRSEEQGGGIYVVAALGGEPRLIARHGRRPLFSPDGKKILYWIGGDVGNLHLVDAAGGQPQPLQPEFYSARYPVWSPDGQRILFHGIRDAGRGPETTDWWVVPLGGGPAVKSGALEEIRRHGIAAPATSRRILVPLEWTSEANGVLFSGTLGDTTNLWRIPISPKSGRVEGAPQRLTLGTELETHAAFLSRNRLDPQAASRMVFANLTLNINLWSLPVDAAQARVLGPMQRLTQDPAHDTRASISMDGRRLLFLRARSDVWVKDLVTGKETAFVSTPAYKSMAFINPDGSRVLYSVMEGRPDETTYTVPVTLGLEKSLRPGPVEKLCEGCGACSSSADGQRLVCSLYPPARLILFDLASRQRSDLLRHPEYSIWGGHFSADDRWILFNVLPSLIRSQIWVARFTGGPVEVKDWIAVTDGQAWDDKPRWSPDGRLVYFISERDGFRCLWYQRLDPSTKRPVGSPEPLHHLHQAGLSMMNVDIGPLSTAVARDRIVFSLGELTGSIWMAEDRRP